MAGLTQADLNLTPDERRAYGQLFQQADNEGLGVVTGDVAVKFFEKTKLDSSVLGEIWQIGDEENRGLLTPAGFSVVLRLIGHCQAGRSPNIELAKQPGPLPRFDGITLAGQAPQPQSPVATGGGPLRIPPLSPDKVNEYSALFEKAGARQGLLPGDAARQVFEKSRLPNEVLGQIWGLADKEARGALTQTEFVVAMHLLASMRNGATRTVPTTLPQGLWDAAARRMQPSAIPRQLTGQGPQRTQSPLARQAIPNSPLSAQTTGSDWAITPQDKARFDQLFSEQDKERRGYITGDQAVPFFSTSGLPEDTLANIWDLADINSEGQLNRDEFAVAMYLIRQERSKSSGRGNLPSSLPARLVPPSMRKQPVAPQQHTAPAFDNAANAPQQPKTAADDLFGLDALSSEAPSAQQQPQPPQAHDPFASDRPSTPGSSPQPTSAFQPRATGTSFKPFQPTSTFGQGLAAQTTGDTMTSSQSSARGLPQAAAHDDLLGDTDPEVSKKFTAETTDLANMSNQVGTLRTQMQETQQKKATHERDLTASSSQRQELETRLAQFRTQYEQEVREVKSLEECLRTSRAETQKLSQDVALLEGTHADLKNQHQQLATAFEADQRENIQLKERTSQVNSEIAQLKPAIEKLKIDARQQKGMVAINKKQLATSDLELNKMNNEKRDLEKSLEESRSASPAATREMTSSEVASPSAAMTSPPAPAGEQSKNPFFRKASTQSVERALPTTSPRPDYSGTPGVGASAFESFFGPSEPSRDPASHPPATSFPNSSEQALSQGSNGTSTPMSGMRTPPHSEPQMAIGTPHTSNPPPPPESRQITSSALPIRTSHLRTDSPTSASVRVNPPASQSGFSDLEESQTPGEGSTVASMNGDELDPRLTGKRDHSRQLPSGGMSGSNAQMTETAAPAAQYDLGQRDTVPGAFPGESDSPATSTPTGGSTVSEKRPGEMHPATSSITQADRTTAPVDDFESAFAGASLQNAPVAHDRDIFATSTGGDKGKGAANAEFPPIQDVEPDDESDSSSEGGFEDSFGAMTQNKAATPAASNAAGLSAPAAVRPQPYTSLSAASGLPTPNAQNSPPAYEQQDDPSHFPKQYEGLLPKREASMSSPEPAPQSPPPPSLQHVTSEQSSASANHNTFPVSSELKNVAHGVPEKDEFDADFDDLDEAKEDDPTQDAFASDSKDDFDFNNPSFTTPADSRANTFSSSIQQTPTGSTHPTSVSNIRTSTETHPFGSSTTDPFGTNTSVPAQTSTSDLPTSMSSQSHDWDAIFSGLDQPVASGVSNGPIMEGKSPFARAESSNGTAAGPSQTRSASAGLQPPSEVQRPELARAISQGTDHDDPILKSLTGLGYPREKALAALEKYDYNLEKAADYLTSSK